MPKISQGNQNQGKILIVEDETFYWNHYRRKLEPLGFWMETAANPKEAGSKLHHFAPDIIILDLRFESGSGSSEEGLQFLSQIRQEIPNAKVIVVTADTERGTAIEAVRNGASDFLEKGGSGGDFLEALKFRVEAVFQRLQLERKIEEQRQMQIDQVGGYPYGAGQVIVGTSSQMRKVYDLIDKVADTDATVLISGESGTGKELVARAIHEKSSWRRHPFRTVDCTNIPSELAESVLFGHEKGSFTGAVDKRIGEFELAHGGTIFLDEIAELKPQLQVKLLRVLQERSFMRLGSQNPVQVDVRVIAATNRDIEREVQQGSFREDLYFRLNEILISLPALRERAADIPLLVQYFANSFAQERRVQRVFTPETIETLQNHDWPGNVRELQHTIRRTLLLCNKESINPEELHMENRLVPKRASVAEDLALLLETSLEAEAQLRPLKEAEREFKARYVEKALRLTKGNQTKAAQLLEIDRNSIRRILARTE
jgi:two-component system response regulator AtoC